MKFTKEEISLCKQVAEKHRKEVEYGDWFIMPADPHLFPTILEASPAHKLWQSEINKKAIPLWTIHNCLEFLGKTNFRNLSIQINPISSEVSPNVSGFRYLYWEGKTPLEACLKAVLAVLEEENERGR